MNEAEFSSKFQDLELKNVKLEKEISILKEALIESQEVDEDDVENILAFIEPGASILKNKSEGKEGKINTSKFRETPDLKLNDNNYLESAKVKNEARRKRLNAALSTIEGSSAIVPTVSITQEERQTGKPNVLKRQRSTSITGGWKQALGFGNSRARHSSAPTPDNSSQITVPNDNLLNSQVPIMRLTSQKGGTYGRSASSDVQRRSSGGNQQEDAFVQFLSGYPTNGNGNQNGGERKRKVSLTKRIAANLFPVLKSDSKADPISQKYLNYRDPSIIDHNSGYRSS